MIILLDMDGVLVDFVTGALNAHQSKLRHCDVDQWRMEELLGITPSQFWEKIRGHDFWYNLKPYPWAECVLNTCKRYGDVYICTSPSQDSACIGAKLDWLKDRLGVKSNQVITTNHKWMLAGQDRLLIDDSDSNVYGFMDSGGLGLGFKQPWNKFRTTSGSLESDLQSIGLLE